jgi:hypothetical protein
VENHPKKTREVGSRREEKQIRIGKINKASRWEAGLGGGHRMGGGHAREK